MRVYYNEWDKYCAQWLRNLMAANMIPAGDVDERDIRDVKPSDLEGYDQCHFFAGIGGWPYALMLAGWPDDRPVWTASCPCQPLSVAGQRKGHLDERHLWPAFFALVTERKPATLFGEQVASKDGREWLAGIRIDMEGAGYACGAADLCAAGVGAPHIRQRLFWVADANLPFQHERTPIGQKSLCDERRSGRDWMGDATSEQARFSRFPWRQSDAIPCADGKSRRIEPGTFPLAHGVSARMGKLRAYGNAIVPQVAAQFIGAYLGNGDPGFAG